MIINLVYEEAMILRESTGGNSWITQNDCGMLKRNEMSL